MSGDGHDKGAPLWLMLLWLVALVLVVLVFLSLLQELA